MPTFTAAHELPAPPEAVFVLLTTTANLPRLVPPDVSLELLDAPAVLRAGDRITWKGRRWGVSQRVTFVVREMAEPCRFVQVQEKGPFAHWEQTHLLEATAEGTRLIETVAFEPPGGMLGRMLTADKVLAELRAAHALRGAKLRELLTAPA